MDDLSTLKVTQGQHHIRLNEAEHDIRELQEFQEDWVQLMYKIQGGLGFAKWALGIAAAGPIINYILSKL